MKARHHQLGVLTLGQRVRMSHIEEVGVEAAQHGLVRHDHHRGLLPLQLEDHGLQPVRAGQGKVASQCRRAWHLEAADLVLLPGHPRTHPPADHVHVALAAGVPVPELVLVPGLVLRGELLLHLLAAMLYRD
jgi:hypothetical protein